MILSCFERREISPGSPAISAMSSTPSIAGKTHAGMMRRSGGMSSVKNIVTMTAAAIGHRASPANPASWCSSSNPPPTSRRTRDARPRGEPSGEGGIRTLESG